MECLIFACVLLALLAFCLLLWTQCGACNNGPGNGGQRHCGHSKRAARITWGLRVAGSLISLDVADFAISLISLIWLVGRWSATPRDPANPAGEPVRIVRATEALCAAQQSLPLKTAAQQPTQKSLASLVLIPARP